MPGKRCLVCTMGKWHSIEKWRTIRIRNSLSRIRGVCAREIGDEIDLGRDDPSADPMWNINREVKKIEGILINGVVDLGIYRWLYFLVGMFLSNVIDLVIWIIVRILE